VLFDTQKSIFLTNFCNPVMPGLRRDQSRDSGLTKTAEIPGSRDSESRDPGIRNPGIVTLVAR